QARQHPLPYFEDGPACAREPPISGRMPPCVDGAKRCIQHRSAIPPATEVAGFLAENSMTFGTAGIAAVRVVFGTITTRYVNAHPLVTIAYLRGRFKTGPFFARQKRRVPSREAMVWRGRG